MGVVDVLCVPFVHMLQADGHLEGQREREVVVNSIGNLINNLMPLIKQQKQMRTKLKTSDIILKDGTRNANATKETENQNQSNVKSTWSLLHVTIAVLWCVIFFHWFLLIYYYGHFRHPISSPHHCRLTTLINANPLAIPPFVSTPLLFTQSSVGNKQ